MGTGARLRKLSTALLLTIVVLTCAASPSGARRSPFPARARTVATAAVDQLTAALSANWPGSAGQGPVLNAVALRAWFDAQMYPDPCVVGLPFVSGTVHDNSGASGEEPPAWDANGDGLLVVDCTATVGPMACRMSMLVQHEFVSGWSRGVVLCAGGYVLSNGGGNNPKVSIEDLGAVLRVVCSALSVDDAAMVTPSISLLVGPGPIAPATVFPGSSVAAAEQAAAQHGRYFTSVAGALASPADPVWSPQGGLSGLTVIAPDSGTDLLLSGIVNDQAHPGVILVLDPSGAAGQFATLQSLRFYGLLYVEGSIDYSHGVSSVHGSIVVTGNVDLRGPLTIAYNDPAVAAAWTHEAAQPVPGMSSLKYWRP